MNPYEITTDNFPDDGITSADMNDNFEEFALKLATGKYDFYTQVDGEDGEVVYLHGIHKVNRTGIYALIPKSCVVVEGE
jgi:hypothetical protein